MQKPVNDLRPDPWRLGLAYVACYAIWLAVCGMGALTILLLRNDLLSLLPVIGPWIMGAVDKFGFVLFGFFLLIWILYTEDALRTSVGRGQLKQRATRLVSVQVIALALAYALQLLSRLWT